MGRPYDLVYDQGTGDCWIADGEDRRLHLARGYSGASGHVNVQKSERIPGVGPIPRGVWKVGVAYTHLRLGPCAIPLQPFGHEAYHRVGFFIHGDNQAANRTASTGCIILPRAAREAIAAFQKWNHLRSLTVE